MLFQRYVTCAVALGAIASAGCGSNPRAELPAPKPQPVASTPAVRPVEAPAPDPVAALLATSTRHLEAGERELRLGHLSRARLEFDRALEVVLEAPRGTRSDPRVRDHCDRLIDRVSAYETAALAAGDGFAEKPSEPASIDELLAVSAFVTQAPFELKQAVTEDASSTTYDVPIPINEKVLAYVDLFQGRLREWFESGLARGAQYLPMIQQVFRAEGLPLDLAYIPLIESAFKPSAVSRASAKGVWQFMRGTALENGLKHDWYIDERADPEKATYAAAKYLKTLSRMFDGDWHLAMASYNGGPGLVQRAMRRTGADDFWDLSRKPRALPRETREYVPMILAAIIIARNPVQYGFQVIPEPPKTYDTVALTRAVDLRRVAEWTGSSIDEIQALNPELRRWTTPVRASNYEIKVPVGTGADLQDKLAAAPPTELAVLKWHTVRRGETVASVARRFGVGRTDLAEANRISVKSKLRAGEELLIPRSPTPLLSQRPNEIRLAKANAKADEGSRLTYRVRRGDTLSAIARQFDVGVDDLKTWNRLRSTRLTPGDVLAVRAPQSARATR
jgi:membrane-bound lytic murein transglycosylase D